MARTTGSWLGRVAMARQRRGAVALVTLMLALAPDGPAPVAAQGTAARGAAQVLIVGSSAFHPTCLTPPSSTVDLGLQRGFASIAGACPLTTTLSLPEGLAVAEVEADVCDTSAVGDVRVTLVRALRLASSQTTVADATTSGTPGCATLVLTPEAPVPSEGTYLGVVVELGASTAPDQVSLQGLRVVVGGP
jgi:hypothetical protein